jgi:N-methylhydantoinase B
LRPDSGGAGKWRGGLGQCIEISAQDGYRFSLNAMFDRVLNPARGREGGGDGAAGIVALDDGTYLRSKGNQAIPPERRLVLSLPGGGGYGSAEQRNVAQVRADVAAGYLSEDLAKVQYPGAFDE